MKQAKRQKLITEIKHLRGLEPTVAESGVVVSFQLIHALKTGKKVLVPRPRIGRIHQLHLLNDRIVYGNERPMRLYGNQGPLMITIDEFTEELTVEGLNEPEPGSAAAFISGVDSSSEALKNLTPTAQEAADGFRKFAEAVQEAQE